MNKYGQWNYKFDDDMERYLFNRLTGGGEPEMMIMEDAMFDMEAMEDDVAFAMPMAGAAGAAPFMLNAVAEPEHLVAQ